MGGAAFIGNAAGGAVNIEALVSEIGRNIGREVLPVCIICFIKYVVLSSIFAEFKPWLLIPEIHSLFPTPSKYRTMQR
jgi:hypothetical protein